MEGSKALKGLISCLIATGGGLVVDAALASGSFCTTNGCEVRPPVFFLPGFGGGGGGGWGNDGNSGDPERERITMWCTDFPTIMDSDYGCNVYNPPVLLVNGCGAVGGMPVPDFLVSPVSAGVAAGYGGIFTDACNAHDVCYGTVGKDKAACDAQLNEDMVAVGLANIPEPNKGFFMPYVQGQAWAYSKFLQWEYIQPWTSGPAFNAAQDEAWCRKWSAEYQEICW